jgi:D-serine deaminase-like pyridoxal phosphate-dependent protein
MQIVKPTLVVNKQRVSQNIDRMFLKAKKSDINFRPHFKTHQSLQIASWFREKGVNTITVSSIEMARYFAKYGWSDITIAFPVNILEIDEINKLASQAELNLLVESEDVAWFLDERLNKPVAVWIKIDTGYGRTGLEWDRTEQILTLCQTIGKSKKLKLAGLLTHSGHSYQVKGKDAIVEIYRDTVKKMTLLVSELNKQGIKRIKISIGDTPTCSVVDDFSEVDEIRPGNFVFYDIMQLNIGSCQEQDIAAAVVCPVVAKHSSRNELILYGGAVHLSKDFITDMHDQKIYGYVCEMQENSWGTIDSKNYVASLSQEHGIIKASSDFFHRIQIGDLVAVLPAHSCLAMNLMKDDLMIV